MSASTVLSTLPRDASAALAAAGDFPQEKVVIRFRPVGSAPAVRKELIKVTSTEKFQSVINFLRKQLRVRDSESVFLYVNSSFAPALDEIIGNLWRVSFVVPNSQSGPDKPCSVLQRLQQSTEHSLLDDTGFWIAVPKLAY
jgi:ubiquitin-like protein ATG12